MCKEDEKWMKRCIRIARNGAAGAPPNPMVGAVLVCDGHIVGEGYHVRCGGPHAEVNAVASVRDRSLLRRSTLYVSLEPCAHYGKTPPCAELIVREGIPRVVVGCVDPFAKVQGRGIEMLRQAGIEVVTGVCEAECRALNRNFFTFHKYRRPYVTLKWAQSADGYLDRRRTEGVPERLSTPRTSLDVHQMRARYGAILVGGRTAVLDNPSLTTRLWPGPNPLRVVLDDSCGSLPDSLRLWDGSAPTWVVCGMQAKEAYVKRLPEWVDYVVLEGGESPLEVLMNRLYGAGVQSLLVEGGSRTLQRFADAGLWDEARVEVAARVLGDGIPAPVLPAGTIARVENHWAGVSVLHYVRSGSEGAALIGPSE